MSMVTQDRVDPLITADEAAELLRMSAYTVRQWAREGKLPGMRLGHRTWRFRLSSLEEWMAEQEEKNG